MTKIAMIGSGSVVVVEKLSADFLAQIHAMVDELIDGHASVLPDGIASRRVVAAAR